MAKVKKSPVEDTISNEFIEVFGAREHNLKDIDIKIYNRWGQLMFESTDPFFKWPGID